MKVLPHASFEWKDAVLTPLPVGDLSKSLIKGK